MPRNCNKTIEFKSLRIRETFTLAPNSPFLLMKISRCKAIRLKDKKEITVHNMLCYQTDESSHQ